MTSEPRIIVASEHQRLGLDDGLSRDDLARLARFHDRTDSRYFELCADGIRLTQYVGLLAVGQTVIEVLPKADAGGGGPVRWRRALLEMAVISGKLEPNLSEDASQHVESNGFLYAVIVRFIAAAERLLREGLVKRYRSEEGNIPALKGRLLFSRHVTENLTRADRWYTQHDIYDRNHQLNGMIRLALDAVILMCPGSLRGRLRAVRQGFEEIPSFLPNSAFMESLHLDRRTERYRTIVDLAWLLIRNFGPDLTAGSSQVLAFMFDMNHLFESTVLALLRRESERNPCGITVRPKPSIPFWKDCYLVPDIMLEKDGQRLIVDTKWKTAGAVSEQDLRQVFAYGLYFGADRVVLLYPHTGTESEVDAPFAQPRAHPDMTLTCRLAYADLVGEDGRLKDTFAQGFFREVYSLG